MSVAQQISEAEYEQIVLAEPIEKWELVEGRLREKPGMSWEHLDIVMELGTLLKNQLDPAEHRVFAEGRVRRPEATIFIPDILVVPTALGPRFRGRPGTLAIIPDPLPLVVEVWSASTGDYDVDTKIPVYQQRGDLEIWRIHPYEKTLTSWVRQPNGMYEETVYREGVITPVALPGATIPLADLFDA
jgi:Uma2 family endonuclease